MLDNICIAVGRLSILTDLKDFPHLLAFRPHHGHAILLLEASVDCPYDMVGPQKQWWRQAIAHSNARMPSRHCGRAA